MTDAKKCPRCGTELPADAPAGICPKCLMAAGLASDTGVHAVPAEGEPTAPLPGSSGFVPPEPGWLAAHFPQLEILELLGHGGMGAVYKARQPRLDRLVALKIIRPEAVLAPAFAERFNREARMLARLGHPHIVAVYDFGEVSLSNAATSSQPRQLYFFLMEYVDGANLRQLMQAGELTPQQALAIVPQICEALQFAHDEGIVHRDIKPENVLLDKRGRVKIADFGLAKLIARPPEEFTLTGTHQVMGTPRYMAPEQMEGSHAVDHRADIYSLGVVFYEMLTGEVPAGHFEPPSKKVEIDVRLDEVVLRSLAREPERRYQHASDVKTDVESISASKRPVPTPPVTGNVMDGGEESSWAGFLGSVVHVFLAVVVFLFGLGVFLGGADALRPLGIPANGFWVPLMQFAGLLLLIAAMMSLSYEWVLPRRKPHTSDVKTDIESISGSQRVAAPAKVGTPVAHVQFSVPATKDIASRVVFHFSGLGYRIVDERPNEWVFARGTSLAALSKTDIRRLKTTLSVRTISEDGGRLWVNCYWAVRTLGSWVTRRDAAKLEAEGRELQAMLGGDVTDDVLGQSEHPSIGEKRRSMLGRAWDDWWAERDRWVARVISGVLVIIALISLVSFFGPHIVIQWHPERHVTVELGPAFSPWFRSETGRGWHEMSSWSWVLVPVAFLAWYIRWQIVKTQAAAEGRTPRWLDSPIALIVLALAMYACMMVVAVVLPHSPLDVAWDAALNALVAVVLLLPFLLYFLRRPPV